MQYKVEDAGRAELSESLGIDAVARVRLAVVPTAFLYLLSQRCRSLR
jgi:hypothetical protein